MNVLDAKNRILTLVRNSPPFGGTGAREPYSSCKLWNAYPREDAEIPTIAIGESGGPQPGPNGMGTHQRRHRHSLQMDVLAENPMEAGRLWQRVATVIRTDFDFYLADGTYGKGFLRAQGIRAVTVGEPGQRPWDDENRIARLSGEVVVEFDD